MSWPHKHRNGPDGLRPTQCQLESTVAVIYVEDVAGADSPMEAAVIEARANAYRRLHNVALTPDESLELIRKMGDQYR